MAQVNVSKECGKGKIEGYFDPKFRQVYEAFVENFERRGEVGGSAAIYLEDKLVLDLWGGRKTPDGDPWERDTICMVWSATKGATAICAHIAADRGLLDLDAPVAKYWPEFACNGKEDAVVSMMLDHSVGVPHIRKTIRDGGYCDPLYMADLVANETAFWKPGTRNGYHGITFAWTVGELLRRVTGQSLGTYFSREVAAPLGAEFWIGLPEDKEDLVAPVIMPDEPLFGGKAPANKVMETDPGAPVSLLMANGGGFDANNRMYRAAEIGSVSGMTNARGIAKIYSPLANGNLVSHDTIARMGRVATATHEDATLLVPTRFSLGFMKSMDNRTLTNVSEASLLMSEAAFGHIGFGGALGFADPGMSLSFGYSMNKMGAGIMASERGQALIDAVYLSMGCKSNGGGVWV